MGLQGWPLLLAPKPTRPWRTLDGEYAHILCLLHLHGRFSLLILQQRAERPVDQAILQLHKQLSRTCLRTTAATPQGSGPEVLPRASLMRNTGKDTSIAVAERLPADVISA